MIALYLYDDAVTVLARSADLAVVNELVGEPGMGMVSLHPASRMRGYVNDEGHVRGLPRNVTGSCVLVALGAATHPYAGPVVITGWEDTHGMTSEIRDLTERQVFALGALHAAVHAMLAGEEGGPWDRVGEALGFPFPTDMGRRMRRYAEGRLR